MHLLVQHGFPMVDCQQSTRHLGSLGGRDISRAEFLARIQPLLRQPGPDWHAVARDLRWPDPSSGTIAAPTAHHPHPETFREAGTGPSAGPADRAAPGFHAPRPPGMNPMRSGQPPVQEYSIRLYVTAAYPCSYLPDRMARSQVADPAIAITAGNYGHMVRNGFRRSGRHTYRPRCDNCSACIPVRVPVARFRPNRSQRRTARRHSQLTGRELPLAFCDEHYALYIRYLQARHRGGGMSEDGENQYREFLLQSSVDTRLVEFRTLDGQLMMVSIIDVLDDGLSAVYTFFEPEAPGGASAPMAFSGRSGCARFLASTTSTWATGSNRRPRCATRATSARSNNG